MNLIGCRSASPTDHVVYQLPTAALLAPIPWVRPPVPLGGRLGTSMWLVPPGCGACVSGVHEVRGIPERGRGHLEAVEAAIDSPKSRRHSWEMEDK